VDDWLLFLGAGASVAAPACLPDFALLSDGVLGALGWTWQPSQDPGHPGKGEWEHEVYPSFQPASFAAEVLFGTLHRLGVRFAGEVARVLGDEGHEPNAAHHVAAGVLACGGLVWTPNVDLCVERAFADHTDASLPRVGRAGGREGVPLLPLTMAGPGSLVKFHGTVEAPQTLAFTDRELLTPLPAQDAGHLVASAKGRRVVLYGYAGADADLSDLLEAVFGVAASVVWYEPKASQRDYIRQAFPSARIEFAPLPSPGGGLKETVPPTARAFLADAAAHGFTVPGSVRASFAEVLGRKAPHIRLPDPSGIIQARLVMRFGAPASEAKALKMAREKDLRAFRWRTVPWHLRWTFSRSLYAGGTAARVIRAAARFRPVLTLPGMRPARDAVITRQCALLLPRGRWQDLAELTTWAMQHRRLPSGKPYPGDLYYRAYAYRYLLEPGHAARDASAAVDGLASALDPERLAGALLESGAAAIYQGRFDDALRCAFDLRYRRGRYAIPRWQSWGGWLAAAALCHLCKPAEAREALKAAEPRFTAEGYQQALADLEAMGLLADRVDLALGEPRPFPPATRYEAARTPRQRDDLDLVLADLATAHGDLPDARRRYDRVRQSPSCPVAAAWAALGLAEADRLTGIPAAADAFAKVADLARERGAHWLGVQAILGMAMCGDGRAEVRWGELRSLLPADLARLRVTELALGEPRVLWTVTI
jgi:tetratricopeptide (TPR) repeat protein